MKHLMTVSAFCVLSAGPLLAQDATDAVAVNPIIEIAVNSGVCGVAPVESAVMDPETNTINAVCGEDAEALLLLAAVPLLGTLTAPALTAIGLGAMVAASGGGGGPADTVSQ